MPTEDSMPRNKETLTVIVNGVATEVDANVNAPLHTIIPKALQQTGNTGQPPENWELRDAQGQLLDLDRKIDEFDFDDDTILSLNLKAGVGG
jgi:hypothetical protein